MLLPRLPRPTSPARTSLTLPRPVNPRSRVLGGFEGNVADYYMFTYVDYFEKEQFCSSQYEITITKEATADADAEVAVSGVLPSNVNGVQPLKGTMASNGEITLPFGQILLTQKSAQQPVNMYSRLPPTKTRLPVPSISPTTVPTTGL